MIAEPKKSKKDDLDVFARTIHLGILTFGLLAWLTGGLAVFIFMRLIYGLVGPATVRFSQWVPYKKDRLEAVWEDVKTLLTFRLPDQPAHVGLAGVVQTFGLLVFCWMALTGSLMFFALVPGREAVGVLHFIEEIHEIGEGLIPVFLVLHVGAVILHALSGNHVWRKMIFLKE